jgi:hypothetical protein
MKFTLHPPPEEAQYILEHDEAICQHLTTQLLLWLQAAHEQDRKRTAVVGKGISGEASCETFDKQDELKRWHEATFPDHDALSKQILESTRTNTMVPLKQD